MPSQYRHRRFSDPTEPFPSPIEPGEIAVNTSNRQIAVGDADKMSVGAPLPLLALRYFDQRAQYATGDFVVQGGNLYRANAAITPGVFNAADWILYGDLSTAEAYADSGDAAVTSAFQAADAAVTSAFQAADATTNSKFANYLPLAGGTMQGELTLAADPVGPLDAVTKRYVDVNVSSFSTGDVKLTWKTAADPGWMMMDDTTIGSGTSGANHLGTQYQALFNVYYNNLSDANAPLLTNSGAATTRSAQGTAAAAWAAGCRITMPLVLGRAMAIAGAGAGLTSLAIGQTAGANSIALSVAQMPTHNHSASSSSTASASSFQNAHAHGNAVYPGYQMPMTVIGGGWNASGYQGSGSGNLDLNGGGSTSLAQPAISTSVSVNTTTSVDYAGSGAAISLMQPTASLNIMVKL
jgi:microcystin-dependent protein